MYAPERTYSLLTVAALALTVALAVAAIVHSLADLTFRW
jgi:hypothetical protein